MESRPGNSSPAAGASAVGPQLDGHGTNPAAVAPSKQRRPSRAMVYPIIAIIVVIIAVFAYRYWYNSAHFVWTDNAQVSGSIIQVGPLNAGQVGAVYTDVGQRVQAGQVIAQVSVPQMLAVTTGGTAKLGITDTENQTVDVKSPLTGVVVARVADPGSTLAAGQPIIEVVDPNALWVVANVNETDLDRVHVGNPVDVTVDSLGVTLPGRVEAITAASASSFSLIPSQNTTGNFSKVVQVVPVKISVNYGSLPLIIGSSVEVNIHIQ